MSERRGQNPQDAIIAEIDRLVAALGRGDLIDGDAERLKLLLRTNPTARRRYIYNLGLSGSLEWESFGSGFLQAAEEDAGPGDGNQAGFNGEDAPRSLPLFHPLESAQGEDQGSDFLPGSSHLDPPSPTTRCSIPEKNGSFNGHWAAAAPPARAVAGRIVDRVQRAMRFLGHPLPAAAAILAIGAAAVTLSTLSRPGDPSTDLAASGRSGANDVGPHIAATPRDQEAVARLSNSWDATWVDWAARPANGASLKIGQRLDLVGGLAEITFDCGAVAILQAPASFVVRAPNGGTLESGRLTARVSGPAIKFWVETDNMKVIDWGTEFGVAVDRSGASRVHVFAGTVEVAPTPSAVANNAAASALERPLFLYAGQGGQIAAHGTFSDKPASQSAAATFVRTMPDNAIADYMRTILASQPWGYWNFNSTITATLVPDVTGNGRFAQLMGNAMVVQGGSVLAVGPAASLAGDSAWVLVPTGATLSLQRTFTFEALLRTTQDGAIVSTASAESAGERSGKCLFVGEGMLTFQAGRQAIRTGVHVDDGQWHHVVMTCEPSDKQQAARTLLYVDGVERAVRDNFSIADDQDVGSPITIGVADHSSAAKSYFHGDLDEVAVYDRCISREEVEAHYWAYLKSGMAAHGHQ